MAARPQRVAVRPVAQMNVQKAVAAVAVAAGVTALAVAPVSSTAAAAVLEVIRLVGISVSFGGNAKLKS